MAGNSNKFSKFLRELKHRKTDRVIVAYAASAFAILQLVPILEDALSLPEWTTPFAIIILVIGFPIAAVFSWFFDITPGGIEKTRPYSEKNRQKIESQLRTWRGTTLVSIIVIIALISFNVVRSNINSSEIKRTEKSIAVLPFENLTPYEILPYNSDIITSIITTGLSEIKDLSVSPRRAVLEFRTKDRSIAEIARKLKVFFIVTGELVNSKDQVLVTVNLVRARKGKVISIWGNKFYFDPDGNIDELSEIPIEIAEKLKMAVSTEEKSRISKRPTLNTAAFLNYLEGTSYQDDAYNGSAYLTMGDSIFKDLSVEKSFDRALFFYDKAIKADSTFALAYAKRAITRSWGYRAGRFTAKDHMEKCRKDIEHAFRFDGDLTEALIAYGFYYYYFVKDFDKALEYFRKVSQKEPRNWQDKYYMALVLRARGKWDQSQALMAEVGKHKIQDPLLLTNIGLSYQAIHQYDTAIYYHDKAIDIMPGWSGPYQNKIQALLLRDGNTKEAEIVLDTAVNRTTGGMFPWVKITFDLYNGRFSDALLKAEVAGQSDFPDQGTRHLMLAEIHSYLNNIAMAREHYKNAFEFFNKKLSDNPDNPETLSLIGISAAGLNERTIAVEAGEKAVKLAESDYMVKKWRIRDLAQIYVMVREYDKALKLLEELLKNPSDFSTKLLQIDPVWRPIIKKPDYNKVLLKYSN
ncbi:MAG: hypothetical protein WAL29_13945 [Bacteroidales bacterium]